MGGVKRREGGEIVGRVEPNKVPANFFIMWGASSTEGENKYF